MPSAALLFESAAQKTPDNPECWLMLGTTQALNEQDPLAISALYKCLELQPDNLTASMSLAASLANETYPAQACDALKVRFDCQKNMNYEIELYQGHKKYIHVTL